eukprot:451154-Rhodomonas_salina.1
MQGSWSTRVHTRTLRRVHYTCTAYTCAYGRPYGMCTVATARAFTCAGGRSKEGAVCNQVLCGLPIAPYTRSVPKIA